MGTKFLTLAGTHRIVTTTSLRGRPCWLARKVLRLGSWSPEKCIGRCGSSTMNELGVEVSAVELALNSVTDCEWGVWIEVHSIIIEEGFSVAVTLN
jgi:hypothetical protein